MVIAALFVTCAAGTSVSGQVTSSQWPTPLVGPPTAQLADRYVQLAKYYTLQGSQHRELWKAPPDRQYFNMAAREYGSALITANRARSFKPSDKAKILTAAGVFYYYTSSLLDRDTALQWMREAVTMDPTAAHSMSALGSIELEEGENKHPVDKAEANAGLTLLKKSLSADPGVSESYKTLGIYYEDFPPDELLTDRYYKGFLKTAKTLDAGVNLYNKDDVDARIAAAEACLERNDPKNAKSYKLMAATAMQDADAALAKIGNPPLPGDPLPLVDLNAVTNDNLSELMAAGIGKRLVTDDIGLGPDVSILLGSDPTDVSSALAKATGLKTICVVSQTKLFEGRFAKLRGTQQVLWPDYAAALSDAGLVLIYLKPENSLLVVQGRGYMPPANMSKQAFSRDKYWGAFMQAYGQLTPSQRDSLCTEDGLVFDIALTGAPDGFITIAKLIKATGDGKHPTRYSFQINPTVETAFPTVPPPDPIGWYFWVDVAHNDQIPPLNSFPQVVISNYVPSLPWEKAEVDESNGQITQPEITAGVRSAVGSSAVIASNISWPAITVSGGKASLGEILYAMNCGGLTEVISSSPSRPFTINRALGLETRVGPALSTQEQHDLFEDILCRLEIHRKIDYGPTKSGVLQLPTGGLPSEWTASLLGMNTPPTAYNFLQIDQSQAAINSDLHTDAVRKWQSLYQDYNEVSIPGINVQISLQGQGIAPFASLANRWLPIAHVSLDYELAAIYVD